MEAADTATSFVRMGSRLAIDPHLSCEKVLNAPPVEPLSQHNAGDVVEQTYYSVHFTPERSVVNNRLFDAYALFCHGGWKL